MKLHVIFHLLTEVSFFISCSQSGAFWVTPSLRTTANRFVINLLIVNFVSCLILSPSLLLNAFNADKITSTKVTSPSVYKIITSPATYFEEIDSNEEIVVFPPLVDTDVSERADVECLNRTHECLKFVLSTERKLTDVNDEIDIIKEYDIDGTVIESSSSSSSSSNSYEEPHLMLPSLPIAEKFTLMRIRSWGLDLVVALSVLSVILVVADTFVAVTDPLRYHSRISDIKAWLFIAGTWILGLIFGVASALRSDQTFEPDNFVIATARNFTSNLHKSISDEVYNTIFSYTYFIVIIMLPFILVICMYWRIYSEARESGQRMRQNGSSPLLQSALNLAAVSAATAQQVTSPAPPSSPQCQSLTATPVQIHKHQTNNKINSQQQQQQSQSNGGLTMKIDKQIHYTTQNNNNNNQQIDLNINNNMFCDKRDNYTKTFLLSTPIHENQLISSFNENSDPDKSSQQHQNILLTLTTSSSNEQIRRNYSARHLFFENNLTDAIKPELRHVHSTPNFQKTLSPEMNHQQLSQHGTPQVLALPTVQVPPKALSYMTSIRHRLSNASSLFKYREESRAARISILVVVMFLISYLPYGILVLMQGHNSFLEASDQSLLAIFTVVLANLSSPFIFAYRNKRVRRGVRRLLGIDKKTNERLQKLSNIKRSYSTKIKNYRRNNKNSNVNFNCNNNTSSTKLNNIRRTHSFASCRYLTPPQATAVAIDGSYIIDIEKIPNNDNYCDDLNGSSGSSTSFKVKKSILKRVCDSSRKWANCNCTQNTSTTCPTNNTNTKYNDKLPVDV